MFQVAMNIMYDLLMCRARDFWKQSPDTDTVTLAVDAMNRNVDWTLPVVDLPLFDDDSLIPYSRYCQA